ncbi:unnamed protein product, partial [Amoebophrya sp. A25]
SPLLISITVSWCRQHALATGLAESVTEGGQRLGFSSRGIQDGLRLFVGAIRNRLFEVLGQIITDTEIACGPVVESFCTSGSFEWDEDFHRFYQTIWDSATFSFSVME